MHLNDYLGSLADLWPAIKPKNVGLISGNNEVLTVANPIIPSSAEAEAEGEPAAAPAPAPVKGGAARKAPSPAQKQQLLTLRDGLVAAGVGDAMMGIADAGYANTVGAALEDTSLAGTCFLEHEWDVDGDRTFVLKVCMAYLSR